MCFPTDTPKRPPRMKQRGCHQDDDFIKPRVRPHFDAALVLQPRITGTAMRYEEIESAFLFVSIGPQFSKSAYLFRDTDQIYFVADLDDLNELPDRVEGVESYIQIPDKHDLDLGKPLVLQFVSAHLPRERVNVERMFQQSDATAGFEQLLERKGLLDRWHKYEAEHTEAALRAWCANKGIELSN